jgi:hypothetical protein
VTARRQISISVSEKVHERLATLATAAGMSVTAYANILFDAAYAARVGTSMDRSIDTSVSRVVVLWGTGMDAAEIAKVIGFSTGWCAQVIDAWRAEIRGRTAA